MERSSAPGASAPTPASEHGRRSTRPLGVVLAVVLIAAFGVICAKLAGWGSPPDDLSPTETVKRMVDALEDGDCGQARKYAWKIDDSVCEAAENGEITFGRISEAHITDETAVVYVEAEGPGLSSTPVNVKVDLYLDERWEVMDGTDLTEPPEPTCAPEDQSCG